MHKFDLYGKEFSIPCQKIYKNGLRTRANFALYVDDSSIQYAMFKDKKKTTDIDLSFLCDEIREFMPKLLDSLDDEFRHKLFEIRFFVTSTCLGVLLIYHKDISSLDIKKLHNVLQSKSQLKIKLSLLARKQRISYPDDILEHSSLGIKYSFNDECFIQPSLRMNENMLEFAKSTLQNTKCDDLLELYCGYGNFTLALAPFFNKVLATELSKKNVEYLNKNCNDNNISNIKTARLKDDEVMMAIHKVRDFNRLKHINLDDYKFSHIMLDPPRSGLLDCVNLAKEFNNIIYISCNPVSAKKDLEELEKSHSLKSFVLFDQFMNSEHLECGFYLEKR